MMAVKLIISDMDGTLIGRDEILSDKAIDLVKRLNKKNILFTIATGRVECMANHFVDKLEIQIPYIVCNGATILSKKELYIRNQIPAKGLKDLLLKADQMGMSIIYTIEGKEYIFRTTPWILGQRKSFDRYYDEHFFTKDEWENILIDKVTVMDDIRDGRIRVIQDLCKNLNGDYCFTRYTDKAIEIVEKNSNKASAMKYLSELLNIDIDEILTIGDHQNDVEMLTESGIGIAVANATKEAKAAADYVCENNYIDGVIEAVSKYCF